MWRRRIIWAVGTKLAIALTLTLPTVVRRDAVDYLAPAPLWGLEPGAPVVLGGQLVGKVISVNRRDDTTRLRVRFAHGAERLPGSRTVRLREYGMPHELGLEIGVETRSRGPGPTRSFALGGLLRVAPAEPTFLEASRQPRDTFPRSLPVWRPTPRAPRPIGAASLLRT